MCLPRPSFMQINCDMSLLLSNRPMFTLYRLRENRDANDIIFRDVLHILSVATAVTGPLLNRSVFIASLDNVVLEFWRYRSVVSNISRKTCSPPPPQYRVIYSLLPKADFLHKSNIPKAPSLIGFHGRPKHCLNYLDFFFDRNFSGPMLELRICTSFIILMWQWLATGFLFRILDASNRVQTVLKKTFKV